MEYILQTLKEDEGLTLKGYKVKTYKTGYQVATSGIVTTSWVEAAQAVREYNGTCGVWFHQGWYYIDCSHWVKTKRDALAVGRAHKQLTILKWSNMELISC